MTDTANKNSITVVEATIDWELPKRTKIKINESDTCAWAKFILDNLTKSNEKLLSEILPPMLKIFGLMNGITLSNFTQVVENRIPKVIKAIDKGELDAKRYPSSLGKGDHKVIAAAMCELLKAGYPNTFLNELVAKHDPNWN